MIYLLLSARLLVAGVFGLAAIGKLRDRTGSHQVLQDFGVPAVAVPVAAIALPCAEMLIAVCLLPRATAWYAGLGALVLLVIFSAVVVNALWRGRHPACHCFGQVSAEPIGGRTLLRNGLLVAIAAFVVVVARHDPGPSALAWIGQLSFAERLSAGVAILASAGLGWMLYEVSRGYGRVLLRLERLEQQLVSVTGSARSQGALQQRPALSPGLPIGAPVPDFPVATLEGSLRAVRELVDPERAVMLVFTDPDCRPCALMLPEIGGWMTKHAGVLSIWVIGRGEPGKNRKKLAAHFADRVLLLRDQQSAEHLGTLATPSALLIRPDGRMGSAPAVGPDAIRALIAGVTAPGRPGLSDRKNTTPSIGSLAPAFRLPDLEGSLVDSTKLGPRETLLLFWSPACGFCRQMVPDLRAWEQKADPSAPEMIVISTGTPEENRALGLTSRIVLDPESWSVGRRYGCVGTPSAVLLDRHGRIASEPVAGAAAVLALATPLRAAPGASSRQASSRAS